MRDGTIRVMAMAGLVLACVACSKPAPPEKERPVEPQAAVAAETGTAGTGAIDLRDAVRAPIDRAAAVEDAVLDAAEQQRDAIDAATGQ